MFGNAVEELVRRGYKVTVITIDTAERAPRRENWRGADVIRIPVPQSIDRYVFLFRALPSVLRHGRGADLIHTSIFTPAVPAWIASKLLRKPVVITVHDLFIETWDRFPGISRFSVFSHRLFEKRLLRLPFAHYLPVSKFTAERAISLNGKREITTVAYPPLDYTFWHPGHNARPLKRELGLSDDTFVYLYYGRPGITKGVEYLVQAAYIVRRKLPDSRLVMLLSREPVARRKRVLAQIERMGLKDHIIVLPSQPGSELPSYLLGADCVVIPSITEGFGYSAVEAATIGCHVVATRGHAVEEVLEGHATFVPRMNAEGLAEGIVAVANGAPKPPVVPMRFTTEAHVDTLEEIYERVMTSR